MKQKYILEFTWMSEQILGLLNKKTKYDIKSYDKLNEYNKMKGQSLLFST